MGTIRGVHIQVNEKTDMNCYTKFIATVSVADTERGRPSKSNDQETVQVVQKTFSRSPRKSVRQAAKESVLLFQHNTNCAQEGA